MYAAIDWSVPPKWSDKELSQVVGKAGRRNRPVDVLVQVRLLSGAGSGFFCTRKSRVRRKPASSAAWRYHGGLFWVHDQRVITLVVLADLREVGVPAKICSGWRTSRAACGFRPAN